MSFAERQELRELIRQRAMEQAERRIAEACMTIRCLRAGDNRAEHQACRGESPPNGGGCLCTCHDNPGVTVQAS